MSIAHNEGNAQSKDIAEQLLGNIRWEQDDKGFCTCPGEHLHTNATGNRACIVYLNGAATIFCQHESCKEEVEQATQNLRQAIFSNRPVDTQRKVSPEERKRKQKEAQRLVQLELRGRSSLSKILKDHRWTYEQIQKDTKDAPSINRSTHWRHIVELFKKDVVIWIGNKFDSGSSNHAGNFKTAEEWLKTSGVVGQLTCPAGFRPNTISRSNENVLHRHFLVVESDVHSKDEVGAIFKWLRDEVGLNLRAVVDTANKSLHGWFDFPKQAVLDELRIILPQLGCDAGLFKESQPCRIPGALRDGKYQKLVFLDKTPQARTTKMPSQALPLPELYYDGFTQNYWRQTDHGGWQKINDTSFDLELRAQGFSSENDTSDPLSELEKAKHGIQLKRDVAFAGPVAGYKGGFHEIVKQRVLVTGSPTIIVPKVGEWPTLKRLFEGLLRSQANIFYGWMKLAVVALTSGVFTPGQAFAIAGPANCGKSLLQNITTELLGGRVSKPFHFMSGKSNFNAENFGAEHLMIEDENSSTDIKARRALGAAIKNITVNRTQPCFGKSKTPVMLTPFWRLTLSMNEEPEDLMVLPPFDEGIADKIILVKGHDNELVRSMVTGEDQQAVWEAFKEEFPAFLHFLQTWEIPAEMKAERFGIKTYHNPELMLKMRELQPEQRLLSLIDDCLFRYHKKHDFEGPSISIERMLTEDGYSLCHEARNLLRAQNSCGTYLGRLTKYKDARVTQRLLHGQTLWKVVPTAESLHANID